MDWRVIKTVEQKKLKKVKTLRTRYYIIRVLRSVGRVYGFFDAESFNDQPNKKVRQTVC